MRAIMMGTIVAGFGIGILAAGTAQAADTANGKKIFARCQACHVVTGDQNKIGPHLSGVMNRKAGSVADFKYSPAMMEAGNKGTSWSDENLDKYLTDPKAFIPGNKMVFTGLKKPEERAYVIAYLHEATGQ